MEIYMSEEDLMSKLRDEFENAEDIGRNEEFVRIKDYERESELEFAIQEDNKEEFIFLIRSEVRSSRASKFRSRQQKLLTSVCPYASVNCATALLNKETPLTVFLDRPTHQHMFPLHDAAYYLCPSITELYISYGAPTNMLTKSNFPEFNDKLPLHISLDRLSCLSELSQWTPKQSIFKLLTMLCLPRMKNPLRTIGLLAWKTNATEEEFLRFARDGKIVELAALLTVAHKKLKNPICQVYDSIQNNAILIKEDNREARAHVLPLLNVFKKAGDAMEAYVKQEKDDATKEQVMDDVANLLVRAGCSLKPSDTDLSDFIWYHDEVNQPDQTSKLGPYRFPRNTADIGLPQYGQSSCRLIGNVMPLRVLCKEFKPRSTFLPNVRSFSTICTYVAPTLLGEDASLCSRLKNATSAEAAKRFVIFGKLKALASRPFVASYMMLAMKHIP